MRAFNTHNFGSPNYKKQLRVSALAGGKRGDSTARSQWASCLYIDLSPITVIVVKSSLSHELLSL